MTEWPDRFIHANGIDIHYYRTGGANKPSIILLHGVLDSGQCWPRVARDLQERFDVIMPDTRGHGRTAGSLEGLSYNVLAADVAALIHALDLEKPYFFGHSMGAMTAATVAANYPQLARAIILEDPPLKDVAQTDADKEEFHGRSPCFRNRAFLVQRQGEIWASHRQGSRTLRWAAEHTIEFREVASLLFGEGRSSD